MNIIVTALSANLQRFRFARGLTQEQLAELAGLSLGVIRSAEAGTKWPRPESLEAIAKALEVEPLELFISPADEPCSRKLTEVELLGALADRFGIDLPPIKPTGKPRRRKKG